MALEPNDSDVITPAVDEAEPRLRHPEKAAQAKRRAQRLALLNDGLTLNDFISGKVVTGQSQQLATTTAVRPNWLRVRAPGTGIGADVYHETVGVVRQHKLRTVCEEAACPNVGECWSKKHATFMILGSVCTRACTFCNVATGKPDKLDPHEPEQVAQAVVKLGLAHVVITSVDRDDLDDGGATHFAQVIAAIRALSPATTIEVLTPDFLRKPTAPDIVINAAPDVFNHNLETVPRLYPSVRPGARYFASLQLLAQVKQRAPRLFTKSGIMVGLGESKDEVLQVMDDLRAADVDFMTIGQYLQPTPNHHHIDRYVTPEEFKFYEDMAYGKGFLMVSASPLTRSSYHAGDDFMKLRAARDAKLGG